MNVAVRRRLKVGEFIEMIRPYPDEERWELLDGQPTLMAPQNERHQAIVMNLLLRLGPAADARGCRALPGLGILNDEVDNYAPIPDIVVRCGPLRPDGYAHDPVLIAEVLSPSTMSNDRGRKVEFYKALPSLRTLLIIYQDEIRVELWRREAEDWRFSVLKGAETRLDVPDLEASLTLAEIYKGIPFTEGA
ncbi:MAG TPA: Uma2 family endonuclease [Beijerinckiaceae bacterium]|jgi:Uma2 family endonuclease